MNSITERIREALEAKGLKRGDFYRYVDITSQSLRNWEHRKSVPLADTAIKMADFLKVSVKWLITGEEDALTNQAHLLLDLYNQLNNTGKEAAIGALRGLLSTFALTPEQAEIEKEKKSGDISSSEIA